LTLVYPRSSVLSGAISLAGTLRKMFPGEERAP
jgi:hypothetical protein